MEMKFGVPRGAKVKFGLPRGAQEVRTEMPRR